nr:hypothetical protein [Rhodospirillales bacterium]
MQAMPIISGIFSMMQGMSSKGDYNDAAQQEIALAEQNARNDALQTEKQDYDIRIAHETETADNRAKSLAGGLDGQGSQGIFRAAQTDKFNKEVEWLAKAADSRQSIIRQGGQNAASVARSKGKQAMWSGISSGLSSFGSFS